MREILGIKFFNCKEVSEILKINPITVGKYLRNGIIKGEKLGNSWQVSETSIKDFVLGLEKPTKKK